MNRAANAQVLILLLSLLTAGCASYQPQPLPHTGTLQRTVPTVNWSELAMPVPGLKPMVFNSTDGLNQDEAVAVAVANNPALKAARQRRGLARAQVYAAGLLPDPELDLGVEKATHSPDPTVLGYSVGLAWSLQDLVARPSAVDQASADRHRVDMEVLWQEWQVAEKTRELFISLRQDNRKVQLLKQLQALDLRRYRQTRQGVTQGLLPRDASNQDWLALAQAREQLAQQRLQQSDDRVDLTALLGLTPDAPLKLQASPETASYSEPSIAQAITAIDRRRPDLVALRYGYQRQEASLRQAILKQFPGLSLGLNRSRDTGDTATAGLDLSLRLPLFDGARGDIAVERARRSQLRSAYQGRLTQAQTDARKLEAEIKLQARALDGVRKAADALQANLKTARRDSDQGLVAQSRVQDLQAHWIRLQCQRVDAEAALDRSRAALATVLGMPLPALAQAD